METPTQILTRHIICLFMIIIVGMHISLGIYYFDEQGSNYSHLVGFLEYVKANLESLPLKNIDLMMQSKSNLVVSDNDAGIFQWNGSSSGYLCDSTTYQTSSCASTAISSKPILETSKRIFKFVTSTVGTTSYATSFQITRCSDSTCSAQLPSVTPLSITSNSLAFTLSSVASTDAKYALKYNMKINSNSLLFDSSNYFYTIAVGPSTPCYNTLFNSPLPNALNFTLYGGYTGCGKFSNITGAVKIAESTTSLLDLSVFQFFTMNDMMIPILDLSLSFPKDEKLNIYLLPKIQLSSTASSSTCTVISDITAVSSYSEFIYVTSLAMFIVKTIFVCFLFPIPIVEMVLGILKHPAVSIVGIVSKIMISFVLILFIIEGIMVNYKANFKTSLQNRIQNVGWQSCFTDQALNQKFIRFPSVFSTTLDDFNYLAYIYMYTASVGLFTVILLCIKIGLDVYVKKKKKYGEYDNDSNQSDSNDRKIKQKSKKVDDSYLDYEEGEEEEDDSDEDYQNKSNNNKKYKSQLTDNLVQSQYNSYSSKQFPDLVKAPSRQRSLNQDKKQLQTIQEQQIQRQKSQDYEMKILSSSNNQQDSDEEK